MNRPRWSRLLPLLLGPLSASSALLAQGEAGEASAPAVLTRFAWPVPATVTVTDTALKKGREAKTRYKLGIAPGADGELRLSYSDFEMLEFMGRDATTPQMKKMLAPVLAMTAALPDCVLSAEGEFLRVENLDAVVAQVVELMATLRGADEAAKVGELMRTPVMQQTLQAAMANDWDSWTAAWIGWDLAPGERVEQDTELPLMGVAIPAKLVAEHHGAAAEHDGCVHLSLRTTAGGPGAASALAKGIQTLADGVGTGSDRKAEDVIADVSVDTSIAVITDPKTLCPRSVRTERRTRVVTNDGKPPRDELERHHFVFDWPKQ